MYDVALSWLHALITSVRTCSVAPTVLGRITSGRGKSSTRHVYLLLVLLDILHCWISLLLGHKLIRICELLLLVCELLMIRELILVHELILVRELWLVLVHIL